MKEQHVKTGVISLKILASHLEWSNDNPILSLLYGAMEKYKVHVSAFSTRNLLYGSWDVWHLHWPESRISGTRRRNIISAITKFWIQLKIARVKKIAIFWTVHNLRPHERQHPLFEKIFWK